MKKIFTKYAISLLFVLSAIINADGQGASGIYHSFTVTAATPPALPAGFTNISVPAAGQDESVTLITPPGFSFVFANQTYTQVAVSTNGWLALIPASQVTLPAVFTGNAFPNNQLNNNTTGYPIIAPLWDNQLTQFISYVFVGNALWVRWTSRWQTPGTLGTLFWVKLDCANSNIVFDYANLAAYVPSTPSASIGIAGVCTGDFYSVSCQSNTTATVDSAVENTTIGTGGPNSFRPYNCYYTFAPYHPYDNCSGAYSALDLGTITNSCGTVTASTFNATASGAGNCGSPDVKDAWFKFIKPANATGVTITTSPATCQSVTGTSVEVYSACGGAALVPCATTSTGNAGYGEVVLTRPCAAETLYVRVTSDGDVPGKFQFCAKIGGSTGTTCANSTPICTLPYNSGPMTTAGSIDNYDSTTSVCHTLYMNGEDYVYSYTPAANQCIRISMTSAGNNPAVFIYSGCPNAGGTYCLGAAEAPVAGAYVINSTALTAGQTYYIIVDNDTALGNLNVPFDLSVTSVGTANAYDACASAINLGTITNGVSCVPQTYSTECATPSPAGTVGNPTCVPAHNPPYFIDGVTGDVWLRFTVSFSGSLLINTYQSIVNPTSNAAMAIYQGASCPGAGAPYACDYNSGPNGMPSLSIPVVNGNTYYIRVWSEHPENQGNFDICFQSACAPPNDLPCAAVLVPMGGTATGFNTCASGTSEPPNSAQCVAGGTVNTVWYKAVVPASGQIRVRTHPLTLTDTQIQGFTFASNCPSSSTIYTNRGCNDDGTACSGGFNDFSEQSFTGLTPNDTLFVAVDGVNSLTGSFEISFIDGIGTVFPPVSQQDCAGAQVVCSTSDIVVADPGYRNNGNICDLPTGYGCWFTGERNSVWYQFTVDPAISGGTATVAFTVTTPSSVDIDIIMWDVTGNSNACAQIQAQTLPIAGCNYAAAGAQTGLQPGGTGYFSPSVTFSGAPRTYLLLLNNWNSSANAGFNLNWATTPISTTPTTAIWSGATDNLFTTNTNWGDCGGTPSCAVDATINTTSNGRQPNVVAGLPAKSVKNITINAGATLTIQAGATLSVCGNFANFGNLVCQPGSIIQFVGSGLQTITGSLTGVNSFANLVINKPSGSVQLLSNIDVAEDFSTSNITSIFNINGKYMKVAGDFTNFSGGTTFTGILASTVEFNGGINQNFTNSNGSITLHDVKMNKTGGKLYLTGNNSRMFIDNTLTLTSGIIVTRSIPGLEVNVKNYLPAAITGQNATSYIDGNLRRKISNPVGPASPTIPASYDFPVGDSVGAVNRYELANIKFTSSTLVQDLLANFNAWPSGAAPNPGPLASECVVATYNALPHFDHGYWTFKRSTSTFGGNYDVSLYNTGYTNNLGLGWTVAKCDTISSVSLAASWSLIGNCVVASTAGNTQRSNMNTPANNSTSFNHHYSTVQSLIPLPIELLSFTAEPNGEHVDCKWATASETNNEYFDVERSDDGRNYRWIGSVDGFGNGTSTSEREYKLIDKEKCDGIRYYRLKQVDIDGAFSYSDAVAVDCRKSAGMELFPNPANESVTYKFYSDEALDLQVNVTDITGRIVYTESIQVHKGFNTFTSRIDELASGAYYLRISDNTETGIRMQKQFFKN